MILFQKNDEKFRRWHLELLKLGVLSEAVERSPIRAPLVLIQMIIRRRRPRVYVFRYLNDYPSFSKTIMRMLSELLVIFLCKMFSIRIWWLCHNVDAETESNFIRFTRFRRNLIAKVSSRIFTTNKLLNRIARISFRSENVDNVSLGFIDQKIYDDLTSSSEIDHELRLWLKSRSGQNARFIFCAGSPAKKSIHFSLIEGFVNHLNSSKSQYIWYGVVVGAPVTVSQYIFNIPERHIVDQKLISKYINFYYRVIDDYSTSYTLYEAAYYKIPILTENYGALPMIIEHYRLGYVVDPQCIDDFLAELAINRNFGFKLFLEENNWKLAAEKFASYYI